MSAHKNIFIGLIVFLLYVCPLFARASGYLQKYSSITQSVTEEARKQFGDDILQKLSDYRIEVQKNAYETTMKLCPAYRIAKGMGLPEYHQKLSDSYYVNHESSEVRKWALTMKDKYGDMLSSSLLAWMYVMYEGGVQPFSIIGGVKADYLSVSPYVTLLDIRSWFYSLYTLFLVDSMGFLQASVHCLGTMDADIINEFAGTLLFVDGEMSVVGHALLFWTGARVVGAIVQGIRWSSRPMGKIISSFLHKRNISIRTVAKYVSVAAFGVFALRSDSILEPQEQETDEEMLQEWFMEELRNIREKNSGTSSY